MRILHKITANIPRPFAFIPTASINSPRFPFPPFFPIPSPPSSLFDSGGFTRFCNMLIIPRNGTRGDRTRPEEILKRKVRVPRTTHLTSPSRSGVFVVWWWFVVCE